MKFILLTHFSEIPGVPPASEWSPAEMQAHADHLDAINKDLADRGQLVEVVILSQPDDAVMVTSSGDGRAVHPAAEVSDRDLLAGFQLVDVDSQDRAIEIAADVSAAPGPRGRPLGQRIEVRPVMDDSTPDAD